MMKHALSRILLLGCSVVATAADAAEPVPATRAGAAPEITGQRLVYDVKWGFFTAGEAVLEVRPLQVGGDTLYQVELEANTRGLFRAVYPLKVWIRSVLTENLRRSLDFHKIQNDRDTRILFDWPNRTAQYIRNGEKRQAIELPPLALDPLGIVMAARSQPLDVGASLQTWFTDGRRAIPGQARVVEAERITTEAGEFSTAVVVPTLDGVGGVFDDSDDPRMTVWISQDERRLPVKVSSKIALGSLVGELVQVQSL